LNIQIQNVLAIEALAGLDELQVFLLKLPTLNDTFFKLLKLPYVNTLPSDFMTCDIPSGSLCGRWCLL
jgi:hypothetical protein